MVSSYSIPDSAQNKHTNFDDNPFVAPVVISVAVLVQILLPFVLWCCALCKTSCKEGEEEKDDQRRREHLDKKMQRCLQRVAEAGNQEELDQSIQQAVQDYQRESEAIELSRKRDFYRNASLCRCISMDMFSLSIFGLSTLLDVMCLNAQTMVPSLRC